jgi:glycosyltransferase involved in cell wall biosynthesis
LPHGFSNQHLRKINKEYARKRIGIPPGSFVIFNNNRNCYRKALDITISSFLRFYKNNNCDDKIKLFLNCRLKTKEGYDILHLILTECLKLDLPYEKTINNAILCFGEKSGIISDEKVNEIYNASDLGVNTCIGEGFGLCNLEHAGLDVPQIVTCTGALEDIFKTVQQDLKIPLLISPVSEIYISNLLDEHGGYGSITQADDFAKAYQFYYNNPDKILSEGLKLGKYIREKYNWDNILKNFVDSL